MVKEIDGFMLFDILEGMSKDLNAIGTKLNDLNVFPVPDKDTGRNMCNTLEGALGGFKDKVSVSFSDTFTTFAESMLWSARGSSGSLLALFAIGACNANMGDVADADTLKEMFQYGRDYAYRMISNPTEGTMLTAMIPNKGQSDTVDGFLINQLHYVEYSLEHSWEQLPILRKKGVFDSGAVGFYEMLRSAYRTVTGEIYPSAITTMIYDRLPLTGNTESFPRYCLELIVENVDNHKFLNDYGDEIMILNKGSASKVHIHTDYPYKVLSDYESMGGSITWTKIDDNKKVDTSM